MLYCIAAPIGSALINKFGCRKVCVCGAFFSAFWFAVSTFSTNVYILMLTYGILGGAFTTLAQRFMMAVF